MSVLLESGSGTLRSLSEHRNAGLEIVYIEKGRLSWHVEGKKEQIGPGSVFFTLPWQKHGSAKEFEPGHKWHFVVIRLQAGKARRENFHFPKSLGFTKSDAEVLRKLFMTAPTHALTATPMMAARVRELATSTGSEPWSEKRRASLAALLLLDLGQLLALRHAGRSQTINAVRMRQVAEIIRRDFTRIWSLEELSARAGLRKSRLSELFRQETGDSLFQYINRLKVEEARRLLEETDLAVTSIAHHCGFSSSQYFANVFKQFTGQSARRFRELRAPMTERRRRPKTAFQRQS